MIKREERHPGRRSNWTGQFRPAPSKINPATNKCCRGPGVCRRLRTIRYQVRTQCVISIGSRGTRIYSHLDSIRPIRTFRPLAATYVAYVRCQLVGSSSNFASPPSPPLVETRDPSSRLKTPRLKCLDVGDETDVRA